MLFHHIMLSVFGMLGFLLGFSISVVSESYLKDCAGLTKIVVLVILDFGIVAMSAGAFFGVYELLMVIYTLISSLGG